jgi:hypothetical protein
MSISFFNCGTLSAPATEENTTQTSAHRPAIFTFGRHLFFLAVIPALLFLVIYSSNIDGSIDLFHEGESVTPAFEAAQGKLPFRDIYLQHGWGVNLLRAKLAFFLFGDSLAAHRKLLFGVSGYLVPIIWIGVYLLLYALFRRKIWILPALILLACADVIVSDRHLLPFLSMALLAWGIRGTRPAFFFAGGLAAAAVFYSLDTGLYALAIGAAFLVAYALGDRSWSLGDFGKAAGGYLSGAAVAAIPFVMYLLWHGIFNDFIVNSSYQVRYQSETWGIAPPSVPALLGPFENTVARNRALYLAIKWYYPALVYILSALILLPMIVRRSLSGREAPMLLTLLAGIIFFPSALGRADEPHLMYAIAPFWILNVCILEWAIIQAFSENVEEHSRISRLRSISPYLSAGLMTVISIGLALYFRATCRNGGLLQERLQLEAWKRSGMKGFVAMDVERAGGVLVASKQAEEIEETVVFVEAQTHPGDPIFDFSNQGAYYFLAGRTNSTIFSQAAYAVPLSLQVEAVEQLRRSPPALVIMREDAAYGPRERQPLIYEWIRQRYTEAARIGPNSVLFPLQPPD